VYIGSDVVDDVTEKHLSERHVHRLPSRSDNESQEDEKSFHK
jgi:hypothetical protein